MGVNHLRRDAKVAESGAAQGNTHGSPVVAQTDSGSQFKRPAQTSGTRQVPEVSAVNSFSHKALHPSTSAKPEAFGGPRAGAKGSQERTGEESGNKKLMSGGAAGGPVGR